MLNLLLLAVVVFLVLRQEKLLGRLNSLERRMASFDASESSPARAHAPPKPPGPEELPTDEPPDDQRANQVEGAPLGVDPGLDPAREGGRREPVPDAAPLPHRVTAGVAETGGRGGAEDPSSKDSARGAGPGFVPPDWWSRFQRQLVENWTGIVGAGVLVAGITFVGGYTGLRMSPFYRSLGIATTGLALFGAAQLVERRLGWAAFGQWLTSSGAAVFLLACFGSSAIPGLAWLTALAPALALLLAGIAVNLAVAYRTRTEALSALHVVLGLVPLLLVPQSGLTLAVATVVAGAGLVFGLKLDWDLNGLVVLIAAAAFHGAWLSGLAEAETASMPLRISALGAALLVAGLSAASHYRPGRSEAPVAPVPLVLHLLSWALGAAAIFVYAGPTPVRGVLLLAAAGGALALGRHARSRQIRWVYITDFLIAEALAAAGLVAFDPWIYHWLPVAALVYGLALAAHRLAVKSGEPFLERVGLPVIHGVGAVLALAGLLALDPTGPLSVQHAMVLLMATGAGVGYQVHMSSIVDEPTPGLGLGLGIIGAVAVLQVMGADWSVLLGSGVGVLLLIAARTTQIRPLYLAGWIPLLVAHLMGWSALLEGQTSPVMDQAWVYIPLLAGGAAAWRLIPADGLLSHLGRWIAYLSGVTLALASVTLLGRIEEPMALVGWAVVSLSLLVGADRWSRTPGPLLEVAMAHLALAAVGALGVAFSHLLVQSDPSALAIEGIVLVSLVMWWLYPAAGPTRESVVWKWFQPLTLESALGLGALVLLAEVSVAGRTLSWSAAALGLVLLGQVGERQSRLRVHAVGFFWLSLLGLVVAGGRGQVGYLLFTAALASQVLFLAWASPRLRLAEVTLPPVLRWLTRPAGFLGSNLAAFLYYPFFLAIAISLYWGFDSAVLTLLWAGEAFVVFAVSLYLRESHFRYMALAALAAVVARLIFIDMSESNLGVRGAVFTGVGLLMLGMNALYNRFRSRYS